ncbi:MAG: hypothetical protein JJU20_14440 [Opitutales bacterium]|nr:hypothetical protein [Opitutales bacterium]
MAKFRELRSADLRKANGLTRRMVRCENLAELEQTFVKGLHNCVPIDFLAWNVLNPQRTEVFYVGSSDQLKRRAVELLDEINGYFTDWHPILSNIGWDGIEKNLKTMSQFQSVSGFRQNPLYRYAYRHLDADYQAMESIGTYGTLNLTVTYNRRLSDFDDRERAMLHLMNRRLDVVATQLQRQQALQTRLDRLCHLSNSGPCKLRDLTPGEIHALASILRDQAIPRDTSARLRQKFALATSKQLTSLIAEATRSIVEESSKSR